MTLKRIGFRAIWALHRILYRLSGHRLGIARPGKGVGTFFLVSTGHRTGAVRRNGLFYIEDGPAFVVAASNAGADVDPAWLRNLRAQPEAVIELGRRTVAVRAREADPVEHERLWRLLVAANPGFATYTANVTRSIPVVIFEPRP